MLLFRLTLVREPQMRNFFEELRHRNVFRVGIAYVILRGYSTRGRIPTSPPRSQLRV
jgi:hypothetical protein